MENNQLDLFPKKIIFKDKNELEYDGQNMKNSKYTFIDLFAGIGGTRLAFEKNGAECVFSSEWNKYSRLTYRMNFNELPDGDITKIQSSDIPQHDILVAGFPCQPFSISGVSKKNSLGRPHGFDDPTQGTLFFQLKRIIRDRKPSAFLLENVKNLKNHDHGNTFAVIMKTLDDELGYHVHYKVLDAVNYVPQHRERILIVGFKKNLEFKFPVYIPKKLPKLRDILEKKVDPKYTLSDKLWKYLQNYAKKHREEGNGFGFGLADLDGHTRTLSARYYKDGSEILIPQKNSNPRRLTPRECARLMGFPDSYKIDGISDTQLYKQFGNSVVMPLIADVAESILSSLKGEESCVKNTQYDLIPGDDYSLERLKRAVMHA